MIYPCCVVENANLVMYADDSTMFSAAHTSTELQNNLSEELQTIANCVRTNEYILNMKPNVSFLVTRLMSLLINLFIDETSSVKFLGVKLNSMLSWSDV